MTTIYIYKNIIYWTKHNENDEYIAEYIKYIKASDTSHLIKHS